MCNKAFNKSVISMNLSSLCAISVETVWRNIIYTVLMLVFVIFLEMHVLVLFRLMEEACKK